MYTSIKSFHELTTNELYDILQLRNKCFIVEQQVPYQDLDNHDKEGHHILLYDTWDNLVAYVRAINPGVRYKEPSCGRICVAEEYRKSNHYDTVYDELMKLGDNLGYKVWRAVAQKKMYPIWQTKGWEIDKEIIEDGIESYEVILRR